MAGSGEIPKMMEIARRRGVSSRHPWEVRYADGAYALYHYNTRIMTAYPDGSINVGGGYSTSDVSGIQELFSALSLPYVVSRAYSKATLKNYHHFYGDPIASNGSIRIYRRR